MMACGFGLGGIWMILLVALTRQGGNHREIGKSTHVQPMKLSGKVDSVQPNIAGGVY